MTEFDLAGSSFLLRLVWFSAGTRQVGQEQFRAIHNCLELIGVRCRTGAHALILLFGQTASSGESLCALIVKARRRGCSILKTALNPPDAECGCAFVPTRRRLNMRRVDPRERTAQAKLSTLLIQPVPHQIVRYTIDTCDIDGTAMAITSRGGTASVEGIADMRLEPDCHALPVVVAKSAQIVQSIPAASIACPRSKSCSRKSGSIPPMT